MDRATLLLEEVRIDLQTNERMVDLLARRHLAVMAVALTTAAGALAALMLGQASPWAAAALLLVAAGVLATQLRALGQLARQLEPGRIEAKQAIERLKAQEVEKDVDAPPRG